MNQVLILKFLCQTFIQDEKKDVAEKMSFRSTSMPLSQSEA